MFANLNCYVPNPVSPLTKDVATWVFWRISRFSTKAESHDSHEKYVHEAGESGLCSFEKLNAGSNLDILLNANDF